MLHPQIQRCLHALTGAYYAAQLGISLKAQGSASRQFLFDLLGVLERMKKDIGPNDTVDNEPASSAYVEDFALKVFAQADNEDRKEEWNKWGDFLLCVGYVRPD